MSILHRKCLSNETAKNPSLRKHYPKLLGFGLLLKPLRKRAEDPVKSVGRAALRIPVQQHIFNRSHLGWYDNSARVLYVDLNAPDNSYGMCKNEANEGDLA